MGNLEGGSSTRDFDKWNGVFLSEEAQCGGLLYWGPWKIC